jgi:hypothetical protein
VDCASSTRRGRRLLEKLAGIASIMSISGENEGFDLRIPRFSLSAFIAIAYVIAIAIVATTYSRGGGDHTFVALMILCLPMSLLANPAYALIASLIGLAAGSGDADRVGWLFFSIWWTAVAVIQATLIRLIVSAVRRRPRRTSE